MIDIAPSNPQQVMGFSNTIATIPGIVGNILTGFILSSTGSWTVVFVGMNGRGKRVGGNSGTMGGGIVQC